MNGEHIHTPDDGRGRRKVILNGKELKNVVFADTRKGKVRFVDDPPKVHKHKKRVITRTKYGTVEVVFP